MTVTTQKKLPSKEPEFATLFHGKRLPLEQAKELRMT
jgi:hypothetical protein